MRILKKIWTNFYLCILAGFALSIGGGNLVGKVWIGFPCLIGVLALILFGRAIWLQWFEAWFRKKEDAK